MLEDAARKNASDIFLIAGLPVTLVVNDAYTSDDDAKLTPDHTKSLIRSIYEMAGRDIARLEKQKEDDFSFSVHDLGRYRVNVYYQRGSLAAVIHIIQFGLPDAEAIGIPDSVLSLADEHRGLVLVNGENRSGRSTTITCMLDRINRERESHIITLEDPIEYTHRHEKCVVSQRELYIDTDDCKSGIRSALRERPGVLMLSKMTDDIAEQILYAAETGILVITSMYTTSAVDTIDRFLDAFPQAYRPQAQNRLSHILAGIVCQKLITDNNGRCFPVFEVLKSNPIVKDMIRKGNLYKLETVMRENGKMSVMDDELFKLYAAGRISKDTVINNCNHYETVVGRLGL